MTTSKIRKNIVNACTVETINAITKELGGKLFSILVDEPQVRNQWRLHCVS